MADTVSKHIDMTTGSLWRNIPLFAFPVAATSILEQLSNLIATVIIGNFSGDQGTLAMAAVGSNVPLTSLMLNLFIGMSLGSNVVIANAIGRNDQNMVKRAVHTSILMALVGFVVIALGEIFAEPMLAALNVPSETMPLASLYLRVFCSACPQSCSTTLRPRSSAPSASPACRCRRLPCPPSSTLAWTHLCPRTPLGRRGRRHRHRHRLHRQRRYALYPPAQDRLRRPRHPTRPGYRPRRPQAHRQDRPARRHPKRRLCRRQHHHPVCHQQPGHRSHGGIERRHEPGVRVLQPAQQL